MKELSEDQQKKVRTAFDYLDLTKTGTISRDKLQDVLQISGQNPTRADMEQVMSTCHDETMDYTKVLELVAVCQWLTREERERQLVADFGRFGKDRSDVVETAELKEILMRNGRDPLQEKEVEEFMKAVDKNDDGTLSLQDLINALAS